MFASRLVVRLFAVLALTAGLLVPLGASSATAASGWTPRGEDYPGSTQLSDLAIPMSDGTTLRGDVVLPADASGQAIEGRFPVIVTITAYNKTALASTGLGGSDPDYLVKRGYAQLTVDARGTGSSEGEWCAFCARENQDAGEIMEWAASSEQAWSNGSTGMSGPSYMGISQLWAAAAHPTGLKAIFPQVPGFDVYRDVVASGGAIDVGFIPLWLGLVTTTGLIPPAVAATDPESGLQALVDHLTAAGSFTAPLVLKALGGGEPAVDGPFYDERSLKTVIDQVEVPSFFIGGEYDLFQRGTPLLYENLQQRGIPTKAILGPWDHLQGSSGAEVGNAGYGTLSELQLRWFDHYVKGFADPALDRDIPPMTTYEIGSGDWTAATEFVGDNLSATSFNLSGTSSIGTPAELTSGDIAEGSSLVTPNPLGGLCTRSANQWTAGVPNLIIPTNPCFQDNTINDLTATVFETAPMDEAFRFQGPLNARLYTSVDGLGDGLLSVSVSDVAPDGTVDRITGGWQVISHRALDEERTRYLDGKVIQPFHPFTTEAKAKLPAGEITPIDVEVFPTAAQIKPGHKLRVAIQAFDVPHLLPTIPDLLGSLSLIRIHNSAEFPSELTVPAVGQFTSSTAVTLKKSSTKRKKVNRATVHVTSSSPRLSGPVQILIGSKVVAKVDLVNGRTSVKLPAQAKAGAKKVTAKYLGSDSVKGSQATVTWKVKK